MKVVLTLTSFILIISASIAQDKSGVYLGVTSDVHLSWQISGVYSNFEEEQLPGLGGKVGMMSQMDLMPKLALLSGVSFVSDQTRSTYTFFDSDTQQGTVSYMWLDASASLLHKPLRRSSFAFIAGAGFSARRILRSTGYSEFNRADGSGQSSSRYTQTDFLFDWTYFMTPQIGAEFSLKDHGRVLCLLQYNLGLRELYRPHAPDPDVMFAYAYIQPQYRLMSGNLNISWLWGLKRRSDFRTPE